MSGDSPLSDREINGFRTEGFVAVANFFSAHEVAAMRAGLDELQTAGKLINLAAEDDGGEQWVNCPLGYHHAFFRALPFHSKVRAVASQLVGDPAYKHEDQFVIAPPRVGLGTNWHQDNHYWRIRDVRKGTAMWIPLTDATRANGTIRVVPRAFDTLLEHTDDPERADQSRCYPPEERAVPIELEAGGALFFCLGTPHCTSPNESDGPRIALAYHFLSGDYQNPELWGMTDPSAQGFPLIVEAGTEGAPYLSGDAYSRGRREYGRDMEAELRDEFARLAGTAAT